MSELFARIDAIVAAKDFGKAGARKLGRNPAWPYVPVIIGTALGGKDKVEQILGRAYSTSGLAQACATRMIAARRKDLAEKLKTPRYRALREHYGLPREIA